MAETPIVKAPDITPPQTPEQTAMLHYFRGAFRLSQGSARAQNSIDDWAMGNGLIPVVNMPHQIPEYLLIRPPRLHLKSPENRINDDRNDAWEALRFVTENGPRNTPEKAKKIILQEILLKELVYQRLTRHGRDFNDDMFESHLRRNLILGEDYANSPIINQLLKELRIELEKLRAEPIEPITDEMIQSPDMKEIDELLRSGEGAKREEGGERIRKFGTRRNLAFVEKLWEDHHPGQKFFPDTPQESK